MTAEDASVVDRMCALHGTPGSPCGGPASSGPASGSPASGDLTSSDTAPGLKRAADLMTENSSGRGQVGVGLTGRVPASRGGVPAEVGAPVALCHAHLLEAYEWMAGRVGVTDVLPAPCAACGSRLGVQYPSGWLCARCEWRYGEHPGDDGALPATVEVVYYVRFGAQVKIGTSANPRARLAQLRWDELLAFERGGRSREQSRHAQFAAQRLGGEWFALEGDLAAHVVALTAPDADPWEQHARWRSEAEALRGR